MKYIFLDGTTDVTRTLHFGEPTKGQREAYTRVLIGQIELVTAIFPSTVRTDQLDILSRRALWAIQYDYTHGTSHGVGHFLSVHECKMKKSKSKCKITNNFIILAPVTLGFMGGRTPPAAGCNSAYLKPGYFLSNEPGYYKEGDFGIRLENVIEVIQASSVIDKK